MYKLGKATQGIIYAGLSRYQSQQLTKSIEEIENLEQEKIAAESLNLTLKQFRLMKNCPVGVYTPGVSLRDFHIRLAEEE